MSDDTTTFDRRTLLLGGAAAGIAGLSLGSVFGSPAEATAGDAPSPPGRGKPTRFQIACMTLPYARYPFRRALTGIKSAGYSYVAWYTSHAESGTERVPVLADDAPVDKAKDLGTLTRDLGLEPVLTFGPSPEKSEALKHRIRQASAAGVAQVLTMGNTKGNDRKLWVRTFREIGPFARDLGVTVVVKPHGGNTSTGVELASITREVDDDAIKVGYDAGNVLDYQNVDPLPDVRACADQVRSFCIKDHRNVPKDQDCGPGFGEIDHYRLLQPVAFTGLAMPLCCENVFAPLVPPPADAEGIDGMARHAREFLEFVTRGLHA